MSFVSSKTVHKSFCLTGKLSYIIAHSCELSDACQQIISHSDPITNSTKKEIRKVINYCKKGINQSGLIFHRCVKPIDFVEVSNFTNNEAIALQLATYLLDVSKTSHKLMQHVKELELLWRQCKNANAAIQVKATATRKQSDKTIAASQTCYNYIKPLYSNNNTTMNSNIIDYE